jgi:HD-GYP domain-containing protein (c-di-GMP phosphodiesterase class II)
MRVLRSGALFHDIGKLLIPEETIKKKKLTRAEMRLLRRHPIFGALIAGKLFDSSVRNVILTHQEELNGSGYPKRLTKSHISLMSRIVSTVDDFCAMTEPRSYRRQLCEKDALAEIKKEIGSRYDPRIVQALRTTIGIES